jgi:hypothetical protein
VQQLLDALVRKHVVMERGLALAVACPNISTVLQPEFSALKFTPQELA